MAAPEWLADEAKHIKTRQLIEYIEEDIATIRKTLSDAGFSNPNSGYFDGETPGQISQVYLAELVRRGF